MISANPATGSPQKVEEERSIEELPPLQHNEQAELIAAPHINPDALKIIRQHLEAKSTK